MIVQKFDGKSVSCRRRPDGRLVVKRIVCCIVLDNIGTQVTQWLRDIGGINNNSYSRFSTYFCTDKLCNAY